MFFNKMVAVPAVLATGCATLGLSLAAAGQGPTIDSGHIDVFHARISPSAGLQLVSGDDTGSSGRVYRELGSYMLKVRADRFYAAEHMGEFARLAPQGGWLLPISQEGNSLWPGWDTQELKGSRYKAVDIVFTQVSAPSGGEVLLFGAYSPFSNSVAGYLHEASGREAGDFRLVGGRFIRDEHLSHTHANWLFTKPGAYQMKVKLCDATNSLADASPSVPDRSNCSPEYNLNWLVEDAQTPVEENERQADERQADEAQDEWQEQPGEQQASSADVSDAASAGSNASSAGKVKRLGKATCFPSASGHVIPANTHVHPRWLFTAPGRYKLQLRQSVTLASGRTVSTLTPITVQVAGAGNANDGHYDIGAKLQGGRLVSSVKNPDGQEVDPAGLVFGLGEAAKVTIPAAYSSVLPANSVAWEIPQVQKAAVPWVGGNSMDPSLRQGAKGQLTWSLQSVTGPGRVIIMQDQGSFNPKPVVWLDSAADAVKWFDAQGRPCKPNAQDKEEAKLAGASAGSSAGSRSTLAQTGVGLRTWSLFVFGGGIALLGWGFVRVAGLRRRLR